MNEVLSVHGDDFGLLADSRGGDGAIERLRSGMRCSLATVPTYLGPRATIATEDVVYKHLF